MRGITARISQYLLNLKNSESEKLPGIHQNKHFRNPAPLCLFFPPLPGKKIAIFAFYGPIGGADGETHGPEFVAVFGPLVLDL